MFPQFFKIFHSCMLRSSMLKIHKIQPKGLAQRAKIGCRTKNVDFFKVRDTVTIKLLGEKKHLSDVSSWLKRFYGHLRGLRDNLKFSCIWGSLISIRGTFCRKPEHSWQPRSKNAKFSNYL